jgi:Fn3 associated
MKKLLLIISSIICSLLSNNLLYAQDDIDGPQKVIIYTFVNQTPPASEIKKPAQKKDTETLNDSFDYLSDIIPLNLKREIESTNGFIVTIEKISSDTVIQSEFDKKNFLAKKSNEGNIPFVIYGSYTVIKSSLSVSIDIYTRRSGTLKNFSFDNRKIGVMIDTFLADISDRILPELKSMVLKRTPSPVIIPSEESIELYGSFSIKPDNAGDEVWYTTDGTEPSKENGKRYLQPENIRSSVTVKAVSFREGFYISKPAVKEIIISNRLSRLTFGITFGSAIFVGKMYNHVESENMNSFSAYAVWDLANIESLKNNAFTRNLGLMVSFDSIKGRDKNQQSGGYLMLFYGGPAYTARMADFLTIDIHIIGGYARLKNSSSVDQSNGALDIFNIDRHGGEVFNKYGFGSGLKINYRWNSFFMHADAGYRFAKLPFDNIHMITTGFGFGLRL